MKITRHGVYYKHEVNIICCECNCHYSINNGKDVFKYDKPIKVIVGHIEFSWKEKRYYYTICPECKCKNPLTDWEYKVVTTRITGDKDDTES